MIKKTLNLYLPKDLIRQIKVAALDPDAPASVSLIVEDLLRQYLTEREKRLKRKT